MPGAYVTSRGRPGVSFGCLGFIFMLFAYIIIGTVLVVLVLAILSPFILVAVAGGACRLGDYVLRAIPPYRERRARVGPIRWDTRTLSGLAALFDKDKRKQMRWR